MKIRMLLIKLLGKLFYRARKWAYLNVYKQQAKISQRIHENRSKSGSADLHGKDSMRKALMCISTNTIVNIYSQTPTLVDYHKDIF